MPVVQQAEDDMRMRETETDSRAGMFIIEE